MPTTNVGLDRAREFRRKGDALAVLAQTIISRTDYADARVENAARMMALVMAKWHEIPGDNSEFFGLIEEFYMDITVDSEIGPRQLNLVNDARDTVQTALAEALAGLLPAERSSFDRDGAESAA